MLLMPTLCHCNQIQNVIFLRTFEQSYFFQHHQNLFIVVHMNLDNYVSHFVKHTPLPLTVFLRTYLFGIWLREAYYNTYHHQTWYQTLKYTSNSFLEDHFSVEDILKKIQCGIIGYVSSTPSFRSSFLFTSYILEWLH